MKNKTNFVFHWTKLIKVIATKLGQNPNSVLKLFSFLIILQKKLNYGLKLFSLTCTYTFNSILAIPSLTCNYLEYLIKSMKQ